MLSVLFPFPIPPTPLADLPRLPSIFSEPLSHQRPVSASPVPLSYCVPPPAKRVPPRTHSRRSPPSKSSPPAPATSRLSALHQSSSSHTHAPASPSLPYSACSRPSSATSRPSIL